LGIDTVGTLDISESIIFEYLFDDDDVGDYFTISLLSYIEVDLVGEEIVFDGDTLEFLSSFNNSLEIFSITGGIAANDEGGPLPTVPIPSAIWLLGSGLIGLIGLGRRKFKQKDHFSKSPDLNIKKSGFIPFLVNSVYWG